MSWKERFASKMNRSSWKIAHKGHGTDELDGHSHLSRGYVDEKSHPLSHMDRISDKLNGGTCWPLDHKGCEKCLSRILEREGSTKFAHEDAHPQVDDWQDLDAHLMSHHKNNFIGDIDDHEWYHLDPHGYNTFNSINGFPTIKNDQPDHYHTNDYERSEIPDALPTSFASIKLADPTTTLRGEGASAFTEPGYQDDQDEELVGPQDLDSNATEVDKFPKSVGVFKNSSWNLKTANDAGGSQFGEPIDYNENRMQSLTDTSRLQSRFPIDDGQRNYAEQRQDANPLTLRSWFTGDDVNGPWPHTKNLSGPLDFEPTDDQNKDSTGPIMGSFNSKTSHFEDVKHPFPTEDDIYNHLVTHHFGKDPIGDDYLKQPLRERLPLFNKELLREHLTFHYDDARRENPLVGKSSWVQDHEHDDNLKVDMPDDLARLSSFKSRYAHMEGVNHPWPINDDDATEHFISHHEHIIEHNMKTKGKSRDEVISFLRRHRTMNSKKFGSMSYVDAHINTHKDPESRAKISLNHEHDDDNLGVDIPENIETIEPAYITSSWHQSFVETFDTHPDEETPDSLLNPADELKNGRPRANDLPNQSAQLLPGMLIDHDQMGGSGTASGSF